MEELYRELQRRGFGVYTDRELAASLGWSKSRVNRAKVILSGKGLIAYRVTTRRGGTEYSAGQCGTMRDNTTHILYINTPHTKERETRARVAGQSEGEPAAVLAAWRENRGRPLLEREVAEMAAWRAQLGEARLIELIELAWDRCTAEHMSMFYMRTIVERHGFKRGTKTAGQKSPAAQVKPATFPKKTFQKTPAQIEPPIKREARTDYSDAPWNRSDTDG